MNLFRITFFILLMTSITASAQDDGYQKNYGVNRNIGRSYSSNKPSSEEIEKSKAKQLELFMNKLKEDLTLDELQFIAIKNEIAANDKAIEVVIKKGGSEEEISAEIEAMIVKSDLVIRSYLNATQKEKYQAIKDDLKSKKKKKGKKKDKPTDEQ